MKRDIAFIGKAGSGKSTAAEFVSQVPGYARVSFAAPLKDLAEQLWGREARTGRDKLIPLGMKLREIDEDVWVNKLIERLTPFSAHVVDDCRFKNEYWRLKAEGFVFIRIVADEDDRVRRLQANGKPITVEQMQSPSECELDDLPADYTITNNDDYYVFIGKVAETVGRINAN